MMKAKLLKSGATIADDIKKTDSGDTVLTMRDLTDMPIQFVQRVKSMLK